MKKVLTAKDVEALLKQGQGPGAIPEGVLLTPSAKDVLKEAANRSQRKARASVGGTTAEPIVPDYEFKWTPGQDAKTPEEIIERLEGAGKGKAAEEGIKIACGQIEELKEMKGIAGVHLMAIEWEQKVPEIAERAGLLPRPTVD